MPLATSLAQLSWHDALARLALAALLGSIIGLEREFREREAGLRTHLLVSLGSALFTIVSAFGFHDVLTHDPQVVVRLDPSRIAAQIVSGIGFLGAGAIIRQGLSIRGLTTAATLWVVAAIGMAAGRGVLQRRGDHHRDRAYRAVAAALRSRTARSSASSRSRTG